MTIPPLETNGIWDKSYHTFYTLCLVIFVMEKNRSWSLFIWLPWMRKKKAVDCESNRLFFFKKKQKSMYVIWQNPHQFIVFQQEKGQDLTLLSFTRAVSSVLQWSCIFIRGLITLLPWTNLRNTFCTSLVQSIYCPQTWKMCQVQHGFLSS